MQALLFIFSCALALLTSFGAQAQEFRALARILPEASMLEDSGRGGAELTLALSQAVPYRVYLLDDPARVVLDFREVTWSGLAEGFDRSAHVTSVQTGRGDAGWSRMVLLLDTPMGIDRAAMQTDDTDGSAVVHLSLSRISDTAFADRAAEAPPGTRLPPIALSGSVASGRNDGLIMVALDPGHGGVDPGAERRGENEADLMLVFALELREVLLRSGLFDVMLTREGDWFVSLPERLTLARGAGADVFLSLHADAIASGIAQGATVYTLSDTASDAASQALAEAHDRADLLAGVDLAGNDDEVAGVLMDLARRDTAPRAHAMADRIVESFLAANIALHPHPRMEAGFSVLKAPDIPSALIELGFISDAGDLANLLDPAWRERVQIAIRDALLAWAAEDEARAGLLRQ